MNHSHRNGKQAKKDEPVDCDQVHCVLLPRPYRGDVKQSDAGGVDGKLEKRRRAWFKSRAIPRDREPFNDNRLQKMNTNPDTTRKLYLGVDVHKEQTFTASLENDCESDPFQHGSFSSSQHALERSMRRTAKARSSGF